MLLPILLVIACVLLIFYFFTGQYNERYWKKRGVTFLKHNKVIGVFWDFLTEDKSFFEIFHELYKKYPKEPAVAFGSFFVPSIYVKDPTNVNHVLQTDFRSFNHRGFTFSEEKDILSNNVLMMYGPKWKIMRQNMTPLFTTAKLKNMYYIIDRSAQDFVKHLKNNPEKQKSNGFSSLNTYCCSAIAASVFGLTSESTFDSPFVTMVKEALEATWWKNMKLAISNLFPSFFKALGLSLFTPYRHQNWFIKAIKQVIRKREQENVKKHDFADICVSLQKNEVLKDHESGYELKPTDEIMAAQAFFFFLAGLDPCASLMFTTMVELGRNPEMFKKLHKEIDRTFERCNGQLSYDDVMDMEYLDNVLNESMRMYPPIGFLTRECVKDTVLPVGNIKIDKGTKIFTPIYEYHHDPNHFEEPEKFDPDRFTRDKNMSDLIYLPFGKGNRACIGIRYSKLQVKAGLVQVLRHFSVNTFVQKGGIKFKKEQVQLRLTNVDIEFVPRK